MDSRTAEDPEPVEARVQSFHRRAGIAAVLLLVAAGLFTLKGFLPALVWALVFAIGLWPTYDRLAARWPRHRRELLPAALVLAVLLLFVVPLVIIAVPLVSEVRSAAAWIAQARQQGVAPPAVLMNLPSGTHLMSWWQHNIGQPGQISVLGNHALQGGLASTGRAVAEQALRRLMLLFFMLLTLFFLLRDGEEFARQLRVASYRAFGARGEKIGFQMIRSVHGTINGLVLVGLAEGVLLGIIYWAAGVPHPTLFGLATSLLAMVPFGAAIALLLAALTLFLLGHSVAALIVVVAGALITFSADHFIRPALIGGATRLPFLWVLLGILGGVEAWGLVGLFLGPALMAALILLWREWVGGASGPLDPPTAEIDAAGEDAGSADTQHAA